MRILPNSPRSRLLGIPLEPTSEDPWAGRFKKSPRMIPKIIGKCLNLTKLIQISKSLY